MTDMGVHSSMADMEGGVRGRWYMMQWMLWGELDMTALRFCSKAAAPPQSQRKLTGSPGGHLRDNSGWSQR